MNTAQTSYITHFDFSQRSTARAALVWGLAAIFYFYELMLLVSPSVMLDELTETFSTSSEQLGSLAAFYYYAYASMQIPVGLLMDRFGPRILLTLASLFCALGCVIFGLAQTLAVAEIGRFVMGVGGSFAVVGCLKLASLWFPVNRFALLTGIMVAVGMMGGVFGQAPVAKLVMHVGWRHAAMYGALIGAILSVIIWFVVSDHPMKSAFRQIKQDSLPPFAQDIEIWIKFAFLIGLFFFPFFITQLLHQKVQLGIVYGLFYVGWFFCVFLLRRSVKRPPEFSRLIGLLGLVGGGLLLTYYPLPPIQQGLLALIMGFFARMVFSVQLPIPQGLLEVMKIPQVWIASLYAGLMFVPTTGFGQLWGVPYFMERFHLEKDSAGLMVSMIFFGWAFGGLLYGWISDKIGRRKMPMGFAAISTLIVMTAILYAPVSALQMKILMFLLGAFSSGFILAFSVVREINAPALTGTAIGFINTLNNASGALAQPVVGKLLDNKWDGAVQSDGNPVYSLQMYNEALLFLPICIVFALVLMPFIRETFCRPNTTRLTQEKVV
ncbi:MAG: MFS transporter [Gammaproteobacteria bacterium]|jgi:MFS family permease|nr:MFS transporter [Gammaproteobacteria bacterium]